MTLFSFEMSLNFLKSLLAMPYVPYLVFLHSHTHGNRKGGTLLFPRPYFVNAYSKGIYLGILPTKYDFINYHLYFH